MVHMAVLCGQNCLARELWMGVGTPGTLAQP
jgi:hypothetical protein